MAKAIRAERRAIWEELGKPRTPTTCGLALSGVHPHYVSFVQSFASSTSGPWSDFQYELMWREESWWP